MSNIDFMFYAKEYMKRSAEEYLTTNDLASEYHVIDSKAKARFNGNTPAVINNYISSLITDCISAVARAKNRSWDDIKEEFVKRYL